MRRWIVFRAEKRQPGWQERKYAHTGSLTKTLFEHYDCSDQSLPTPGYRPSEFIQVQSFADPNYPNASTHHRLSDWEVTRVETYTPDNPVVMDFDLIVICYCKYSPINAPLHPLPARQVSVESFAGEGMAYQEWLETQQGYSLQGCAAAESGEAEPPVGVPMRSLEGGSEGELSSDLGYFCSIEPTRAL